MRVLRLLICISTITITGTAFPVYAADSLEKRIDQHINARLQEEDVTPATQADDVTLIRRLTLDLVGRIPTWNEVVAFSESRAKDKRAQLVDRLMSSPGFARYQGYLFDVMLNDKPGRDGKNGSLREYLTLAMKENRSWDRIFQELMLPDDANARLKGASEFLRPRLNDADRLTNDVSISFFGVNISCAQCHDHPLVKDWTQDHFYGMKSFLSRTYDAGGFVGERSVGLIRYKPNRGAEKAAKMMFLTGTAFDHPSSREPTSEEAKRDKPSKRGEMSKEAPPKPDFSAREKLVSLALKDGRFLARSIVNRIWHRFLGYGLVNPLDQLHSENPASHPELMNELAQDVIANKFDLRRLIRGIVMSETYSRSSMYQSSEHPQAQLFAVAQLKPLTPQQLATSLKIASADPQSLASLSADEFEKRIEQMESSSRNFASLIAQPGENFQIGVGEALLFSNGDRITKEFLTDGAGSLLARSQTLKNPQAVVDLLITSALCRPVTDAERKLMTRYLETRSERSKESHQQLLWAIVTCSEFRFNH